MNRLNGSLSRRAAAIVLAFSLVPMAASAQTKIKSGWNLFSPEQDAQIGQQSAVEAEQQLPILRDSQVNSYVNSIGQRLAANAGGPGFRYQFRVVNASDINAFALPGGYVYINRGVLDQARNEGEVAGVIAHEIAHVALRHGTHQASKAYAAQAGISILGGILGGHIGAGTAQIINAVGGIGLNALFLKYSRDLESQADIRGAQILAASGYSPTDMVNFFYTLERVDKSKKTNWMSDHPAPPDRIKRIQREAQMLRVTSNPTENVQQLASVKSRMRSLGAAPTMQQIAQNGAAASQAPASRRRTSTPTGQIGAIQAPSSSARTFTSPSGVYRVSYPANWRVYQEGSTGVTFAPEGGVVNANGQTEVIYGAIVNHYDPFGNTSASLMGGGNVADATNDLIAQIQRSSPHLRVLRGSEQQFSLAGGMGLAASLGGVNPNTGIQERVTVVTRQLPDSHLIYMLFVTPERDVARYSGVLQSMVNSMAFNDARQH